MASECSVRSVDRAVSLLIALGQAPGQAGVTELARSVQLHKSTASRLLATMLHTGLVDQDPESGKYKLGLAMIRLGGCAEKEVDLGAIAMPELKRLSLTVRVGATLGVLRGDSVVTAAAWDPQGQSRGRTGRVMPLHATAAGKLLLASEPERNVVRLVRAGLTPFTSHTIVLAAPLLEELARIRRRGYATAFGENEPSVNAVAVPIFGQRSTLLAALELSAWGEAVSLRRLPFMLAQARVAAAAIRELIGGTLPVEQEGYAYQEAAGQF